jgi:hypothetical protein
MNTRDYRHCEICGNKLDKFSCRCEEHYRCDRCGTKENLITGKNVLCRKCDKERIKEEIEKCKENPPNSNCESEVVCPWCGYIHHDSWEIDNGEFECNNCGNKMEVVKEVSVTYSTEKI